MKTLGTVIVVVLIIGHLINKRMNNTPTRRDAINQSRQYKQLKELLTYEERPTERHQILQKMDSLRSIKNEYSYIK